VPRDELPFSGTFWEVRNSIPCIVAPLPCPPLDSSFSIYQIRDGEFLVDETAGVLQLNRYSRFNGADASSVLQEQVDELLDQIGRIQGAQSRSIARSSAMDDSDASPSPGFDPAYTPTTNDLWLQITGMTNTTGTFVIHPPWNVANGVYDLFATTNLAPMWWGKLLRCAPGQTNLTVTNLTSAQEFFILGLTNDTDGGGMSDAWEGLLGLHPNNSDDDLPTPRVGISALDSVAMKDDPSNTASFQITRLGGHMTWPLTLPLQLSGTATIYVNYSLTPATVTGSNVLVTIPTGETNVTLTLTARDDHIPGDTTTATLALQSNSDWSIDPARASATAFIEDTYSAVPCAWWNVTDISSPAQPVNIGELQEPFAEPDYVPGTSPFVPPMTNPWHTRAIAVTEAYGTTASGGTGQGTVFRMDPAGPPQGMFPNELVQVGDTLYGTTEGLGAAYFGGYGTIFSINTNGSEFTTLYVFNGSDGREPQAGLVLSGGILYGTTYSGGAHGYGNVFGFNITNNTLTVLYSFTGAGSGDGASASAKLALTGNVLFGTTSAGGANDKGTVFEINTNGTGYQILHSFAGGTDGKEPEADLLFSSGVLYGTTPSGGSHGFGTLFTVNTNGSSFATLHQFSSSDGSPEAGLMLSGGTMFGTTYDGGTNGDGTVFSINTSGSNYIVLHSFDDSNTNNGASPVARLTLSGSTLYGTTYAGGAFDDGVVFCVSTNGTSYTNLYSFKNGLDGQLPDTALILSGDTLYGTTPADSGPPNYGTLFSIHTDGSGFEVLSTFSTFAVIHTFSGTDGAHPSSQLAMSGSAFYGISTVVYGTTSSGGSHGYGTVFRVNTDATGFTNLYEFTGSSDGGSPQAGLLIDGNTLYGTTTNSIFKINTDGANFTRLTNIAGASQLILSVSGDTLYGTTTNGGSYHFGSVFSIKTDGGGFTNIHEFSGGSGGAYPGAGLELYGAGAFLSTGATNFVLYGTTYGGGANDDGLVFSVNIDGTGFTDLHDFDGANDGANPLGGLLLTNDNVVDISAIHLFGTTSTGGTNGGGTVFGLNGDGGGFRTIYSLSSGAGANPKGSLAYAAGKLCGTASTGGAYTNGMVFGVASDGSGFTDLYDFDGNDGASPQAGLSLTVADNVSSIWSLDSAIYVSAENITNLSYSIAMDNYFNLFVNGNFVNSTNHSGRAQWSPYLPLPYLHAGENDLRVVIAGDSDAIDYFTMAVKSAFTNTVYGTTYSGGSNNDGTVFKLSPAGYEILYNFSNQPDGQNPIGDLVLSGTTLYGVTINGGVSGYGSIFSISTNGAGYVTLYSFANTSDGAYPRAGMILCGNTLYGTTSSGGANGYGEVFKILTNGSGYANLHSFASSGDGQDPEAPLVLSGSALYGTTYSGGSSYSGTIFSIGTNGSGYTTLYSFNGSGGSSPRGRLFASSGSLYGVTESGGTNGYGTVFSIGVDGMNYQMLHSFANQPDGANPSAGLSLTGNTLYGTTYYGGSNALGIIFSINFDGSGYTNLLSFGSADSSYGAHPRADLLIQGNSLYGTAYQGGAVNAGMVFGINTNGTGFYSIYDFRDNPDGGRPEGGVCSP
jgi:uncharacterized repeat protein (TIGR03803 family)